jgi:hypothetical protein
LDDFYIDAKEQLRKSKYTDEYYDDLQIPLIKFTLLNQFNIIEQSVLNRYLSVKMLQNMLILHGKALANVPEFINLLFRRLFQLQLKYDERVLFKILTNIKQHKYRNNIHFRYMENVNLNNIPPIPAENRLFIEKTLPQIRYQKQFKKIPKPFKVGQIVGAKDKENKWWLSRVLHVHKPTDTNIYWYYIRFEGWGNMHDEWINSRTYRVRYFNAKKHFLKKTKTIIM